MSESGEWRDIKAALALGMRALQTTEVTKVCGLPPKQNKVLALRKLLTFLWGEFCDQIILNVVIYFLEF